MMGMTIMRPTTLKLAPEKNQTLNPAAAIWSARPIFFHLNATRANPVNTMVNSKYWKISMNRFSHIEVEYQPS